MEKKFNIKRISATNVKAAEICRIMDEAGIGFVPVDNHCWAEAFPYRPKMEVRMVHNGAQLLINYRVTEETVRAVAPHDDGNVWEDSCCELFLSPVADGTYYNMECNAAGTILIGFGPKREGRERAPQEVLDKVQRWASLGREAFEERVGECSWEVALVVPYSAFFLHRITSLDGQTIRANFYKCGDKLQTPHFLSWNPIELEKPNFHCPEFFGALHFE